MNCEIKGKNVNVLMKCGVYHISDKTLEVRTMCDRAKLAKSSITEDAKNPYAIFDEKMQENYLSKNELMERLNLAIEREEFRVYYQPIVDLHTGEIVAAEALARWVTPEYGVVSPEVFIPTLEESGMIAAVDLQMEKSVKGFLENRDQEGLPIVPIDMNLSWKDFCNTDIIKQVIHNLKEMNYPKGMIRVEVTESSYASIVGENREILQTMKDFGVKLLVDDFGNGYSSFSTIRDFDFDMIKLDKGFIQKIGKSEKSDNIISILIHLGHQIGSEVVAEGVETKEQADFLLELGCDYIQGYYYYKPMPEDEFAQILDMKRAKAMVQ